MKNKNSKVLLGAATLAAVVAQGAPEALAATKDIPMTAQVIAAIQITKTASLLFGFLMGAMLGNLLIRRYD